MVQTLWTKLGSPSALRPGQVCVSSPDAELWQGGRSRVEGAPRGPPVRSPREAPPRGPPARSPRASKPATSSGTLARPPTSWPRLRARGGGTHSAPTAPRRCWAQGPGRGHGCPGARSDPVAGPEACVLTPSSPGPLPPFPSQALPPWPRQRHVLGPAGRPLWQSSF